MRAIELRKALLRLSLHSSTGEGSLTVYAALPSSTGEDSLTGYAASRQFLAFLSAKYGAVSKLCD